MLLLRLWQQMVGGGLFNFLLIKKWLLFSGLKRSLPEKKERKTSFSAINTIVVIGTFYASCLRFFMIRAYIPMEPIFGRGIYVTIYQGAKFCLLETLLFTFQIQWILWKINNLSYTVIVMLRPFQKYSPIVWHLS